MRTTSLTAALGLVLWLGACAPGQGPSIGTAVTLATAPPLETQATATSIPFRLDSQRILLPVSFTKANGESRQALAWFNMGMARPVLSKALYRDLELDQGRPLRLRLGEVALEIDPAVVVDGDGGAGVPDFAHLFHPTPVEAMLPAGMLQNFAITLDYRRRILTLARPGAMGKEGVPVPVRLNPDTGLVTVEASLEGRAYPLVLDAGSGYSWMRGAVIADWLAAHPDWRRAQGAVGPSNANMVDYAFEKAGVVARIPEMAIGSLPLRNVGLLGTGPVLGEILDGLVGDLFWDNWQKAATGTVAGWLGGNVLQDFALTIDYPNRISYWQRQADADGSELDQVGVTLVRRNGRYFIGGIVRRPVPGGPDAVTVDGVEIGDELLSVDGQPVTARTREAVLSALHGTPGERRRLGLLRDGRQWEVETTVTRFD